MTDFRSVTKPIPINYKPSKFSFNNPSNNIDYLYNLNIILKNNISKKFIKIEKKKYSNIIDIDDNILYDDIKYFKLNIMKLPSKDNQSFILEDNFNNNTSSFSKRSDDIYIEFTQNNSNITLCNCYFIGVDFNSIFISPP